MEIKMRSTREMLVKLARDTVEKRFKPDPGAIAVFLVGSVLRAEPLLGGTTDIDLLVITKSEPPCKREITKLSNEIHLDILFEAESLYAKPRDLRGDPWRGWTMWDPMLLHEKGKFFEYTQSILRAQFEDPQNILARARAFAVPAREAWTMMQLGGQPPLREYLSAVENAANGLAVLGGFPLAERRFLLEFSQRAQLVGHPELSDTLLAMLGGLDLSSETLRAWLPDWEAAFTQASQNSQDTCLHNARLSYYKQALLSLLDGPIPQAALWPMLNTWALASESGNLDEVQRITWREVLRSLKLDAPGLELRLQGMDHYLDVLEETLDELAVQNGL
jgi:predicted nucleotidyltransferase